MTEMLLHISGAWLVLSCAALRLNLLKFTREDVNFWTAAEVLGLAGLMGGCAGAIGEWFLPNAEFHSETLIVDSMAVFAIGISRANLCQVVARLRGWDGRDRRAASRAAQ